MNNYKYNEYTTIMVETVGLTNTQEYNKDYIRMLNEEESMHRCDLKCDYEREMRKNNIFEEYWFQDELEILNKEIDEFNKQKQLKLSKWIESQATEEEMNAALIDYLNMRQIEIENERLIIESKERALRKNIEAEQRKNIIYINNRLAEIEEWMKLFPEEAKNIGDIATEEQLEQTWRKFNQLFIQIAKPKVNKVETKIVVKKVKRKPIGPNNQKARKEALEKKKQNERQAFLNSNAHIGKRALRKQRNEDIKKKEEKKKEEQKIFIKDEQGCKIMEQKDIIDIEDIDEETSESEEEQVNEVEETKTETKTETVIEQDNKEELIEQDIIEQDIIEQDNIKQDNIKQDNKEDTDRTDTETDEEDFLSQYAKMHNHEYISKAKPEEKQNKQPNKQKQQRVKNILNIDSRKSYVDNTVQAKRSQGFDIMSDKEKLQETLTKTKMCKSTVTGKKCLHGKKCRFAHSKDELTIRKCAFGDACRFVCYDAQTSEWKNENGKAGRICNSIHPGEDKFSYFKRCNIRCASESHKVNNPKKLTVNKGTTNVVPNPWNKPVPNPWNKPVPNPWNKPNPWKRV